MHTSLCYKHVHWKIIPVLGKNAWEEILIMGVWTIPSFFSQILGVWDAVLVILWSAERLTPNSSKMRRSKRWPGHFATKTPQIAIRNEADMIWTIKRLLVLDVLGIIVIQNRALCTSVFLSCIDFLQHLRRQSLQGSCWNCLDQFLQWKVPDPFPNTCCAFCAMKIFGDCTPKTSWLAKVS